MASACLNGVGVLGELSRIDLLIAGVLKLKKKSIKGSIKKSRTAYIALSTEPTAVCDIHYGIVDL